MRILVIEDNKEISDMLRRGLEAESFCVDVAEDGKLGSYLARTNEYDLIILDNRLPEKDGNEVCVDIRRSGKNMPIILLSVEADIEEKVRLLRAGADDYMTKPFSFNELLARIRAILRRPVTSLPERLVAGNLILDSRTQEVKRGKNSIYLTRKEYSLLELLIRHNGQVVSRGAIMEHVWDLDGNPFSNTIETHIFNIRKKLGGDKNRLIWNVPGRGYKLSSV